MTSSTVRVHFAPGATPPDPGESVERLTVHLITELLGVTQHSVSDRFPAYSARLMLDFAHVGLCSRARFLGIDPTGHAPLEVHLAGYWGSTCAYDDPDVDEFIVYLGEYAEGDKGETLAIAFPSSNVYPYFTWPDPIVEFVPPLGPGDTAPPIGLILSGLKSLAPVWVETDVGVQLPMRMILKTPEGDELSPLQELLYEDAPGFTGSNTSVRCKVPDTVDPKPPSPGVMAVTGKDIAEAAVEVGKGLYTLWWRIFKGGGDMLYKATCLRAVFGDEYRDRRHETAGGFGTEMTSELKVAQVRVMERPLQILTPLEGLQYSLQYDGLVHEMDPELLLGNRGYWVSTEGDVLSWDNGQVLWSGRVVTAFTLGDIRAACVVTDALGVKSLQVFAQGYPPDDDDVGAIYRMPLYRGAEFKRMAECGLPEYDYTPATNDPSPTATLKPWDIAYQFSQDGTRLLTFSPFLQPWETTGHWYPGVAWEAVLEESTEEQEIVSNPPVEPPMTKNVVVLAFAETEGQVWNRLHVDPLYVEIDAAEAEGDGDTVINWGWDPPVSGDGTSELTETATYAARLKSLIGAWYAEDKPVLRFLQIDISGGFSYSYGETSSLQFSGPERPHLTTESTAIFAATQSCSRSKTFAATCTISDRAYQNNEAHTYSETDVYTSTLISSSMGASSVGAEEKHYHYEPVYAAPGYWQLDSESSDYSENRNIDRLANGLCVPIYEGPPNQFIRTQKPIIVKFGARTTASQYTPEQMESMVTCEALSGTGIGFDTPSYLFDEESQSSVGYGDTDLMVFDSYAVEHFGKWAFAYEPRISFYVPQLEENIRKALDAQLFALIDSYSQYAPPVGGWNKAKERYTLHAKQTHAALGEYQEPYLFARVMMRDPTDNHAYQSEDSWHAGAEGGVVPEPWQTPEAYSQPARVDLTSPKACILTRDPEDEQPEIEASDPDSLPTELLNALNAYRKTLGRGEVTTNTELTESIALHLAWLKLQANGLSHEGEGGSTPLSRAQASGYAGDLSTAVEECLALNHKRAKQVLLAWQQDAEAQAILAGADWVDAGIYVLETGAAGRYWWGLVLGVKHDSD